jgi:hypothetical protein
MHACLLGFLAKYKPLERVVLEDVPTKVVDENSAILDKYKMLIHQHYGILRWERREGDLHGEEFKYAVGTKEHETEHEDLEKCQNELFGIKRLVLMYLG